MEAVVAELPTAPENKSNETKPSNFTALPSKLHDKPCIQSESQAEPCKVALETWSFVALDKIFRNNVEFGFNGARQMRIDNLVEPRRMLGFEKRPQKEAKHAN